MIQRRIRNYKKFTVDDNASKTDKNVLKKSISTMVGEDVKTFPMILTSEMEFIGGYDDLEHYIHKLSLKDIVIPTQISSSCTLDDNGCA